MDKLPDYTNRKFLIVDDEPFMLSLVDRMLKECGATYIVKATDGVAGLKAIKDDLSQVDCIISDCNMKPANGLQFLQAVRTGINPRIPRDQAFVMLTGQGDTDVVKTSVMLDVSGYLVKPVALDKLAQTLERVFRKPIEVKEPDYYRAIKLAKIHSLDQGPSEELGAPTRSTPWVVMSRSAAKTSPQIKAKVDAFKMAHATRDGEQEVKIKNRHQCDLAELTAGTILAEDIHADEDQILLRKGTTLTAGMIDRLRELAVESNSRNYVWVGEIAP